MICTLTIEYEIKTRRIRAKHGNKGLQNKQWNGDSRLGNQINGFLPATNNSAVLCDRGRQACICGVES